jgi:hypothetical protein
MVVSSPVSRPSPPGPGGLRPALTPAAGTTPPQLPGAAANNFTTTSLQLKSPRNQGRPVGPSSLRLRSPYRDSLRRVRRKPAKPRSPHRGPEVSGDSRHVRPRSLRLRLWLGHSLGLELRENETQILARGDLLELELVETIENALVGLPVLPHHFALALAAIQQPRSADLRIRTRAPKRYSDSLG